MITNLEIPFERITYRNGQLLTARDLQADQRRNARLRGLHTRYLHQTWGIALGLEVRQVDDDSTVVALGPGYAVDEQGRDLLLTEGLHIPVPDVAGPQSFVLTLSYRSDRAYRDQQRATVGCLSGGLDPRREQPVFTWRRPEVVRFGPEVPLVQVVVREGAIQEGLDRRVRRNAQPFVRPHLGWGVTEAGRTGWDLWEEGERRLGLEVPVDTTEAGFTRTPYYFALLQSDTAIGPWSGDSSPAFFLDNVGFITNPTQESFTYRLLEAEHLPATADGAERHRLHIAWLGLEPVIGCEPPLTILFYPSGLPIQWVQLFYTGGGSG